MATFQEQYQRVKEMPSPQVDNLFKATPQQLVDEIIMLRTFIASMVIWAKEVMQHLGKVEHTLDQYHEMIAVLNRQRSELYDRVTFLEGELGASFVKSTSEPEPYTGHCKSCDKVALLTGTGYCEGCVLEDQIQRKG